MTREEQINLYLKERNIPITSLEANSIIEGIECADKHPTHSEEEQVGMGELGMIWQKKALIKDEDIKDFVDFYNVKCHPLYYDENGTFHPERRLGCMCCPLASTNKRIEMFKKYPSMVRFYISNGRIWLNNHQNTKTAKRFKDVYEWFTYDLFKKKLQTNNSENRLFNDEIDHKRFLENYFGIKL